MVTAKNEYLSVFSATEWKPFSLVEFSVERETLTPENIDSWFREAIPSAYKSFEEEPQNDNEQKGHLLQAISSTYKPFEEAPKSDNGQKEHLLQAVSSTYKPFVEEPPNGNGLKEHLLKACEEIKANNTTTDFQKKGFLTEGKWIVSRDFKLVNCVVHKAGSTNIGRILYVIDHLDEYDDTNQLSRHLAWKGPKFDKKYESVESFEADFKTYKKFMFVRDPIERLLSAYRAHLPNHVFRSNYNMSFETFLQIVAEIPDQQIEAHLASLSRMCSPCRMTFDFIGSTDSFGEDMNEILESVGADKYIKLPERNQTGYPHRKSSEVLDEYLKDIPKPLVKRIYEKFYWDYFLFGFTKPNF